MAEMSDTFVYRQSQYVSRLEAMLITAFVLLVWVGLIVGTVWRGLAGFEWVVHVLLLLWGVGFAVVMLGRIRLTVTVTNTDVHLVFLFGWPRKRIARSLIQSVMPLRMSNWGAVNSSRLDLNWYLRGEDAVRIVLVRGKDLLVSTHEPDALIAALNVPRLSGARSGSTRPI